MRQGKHKQDRPWLFGAIKGTISVTPGTAESREERLTGPERQLRHEAKLFPGRSVDMPIPICIP